MSSDSVPLSPYRKRAEDKFLSAAQKLQKALPNEICDRLGKISFPKLDAVEGVVNKAKALSEALESLIQAANATKGKKRRKKVSDVMERWFRASYPFANLFLSVATTGSAVSEWPI